jgi:hypothetical protein
VSALAVVPAPAHASTIIYRTDAELIALSERVVHARVLRQRTERPNEGGTIYTVTTLAVLEDLTGRDGDIVEVWELGGVYNGEFLYVGGAVQYVPGSEVLVALERGPRGLRSVAMGFSKFDVVPAGPGRGRLVRNMAETMVVGGPAVPVQRTMSEFRVLAEMVTGRRSRVAPQLALEGEGVEVSQGFTTLSNLRWVEADSGVAVGWYRNTAAPAPVAPEDDTPDVLVALEAWTDPSSASIILSYEGTTNQTSPKGPWSGLSSSGVGVINYEDPNGEISGSTLAIGGGSGFEGCGGEFNGETWNCFTRGYVIFQNAADLSASFKQSLNFRRVLQHEIGHAIGLGHSAEGTANIMHASCCASATPVPPALGPDDLAGLEFIYPVTPPSTCTYTLNPTSASITNSAQTLNISVLTESDCGWTVSTSTDWLTIESSTSNTGGGTVTYSASANAGPARPGLLIVAGMTFNVTQAIGAPTVTAVNPSSGSQNGGTSITVTGTNFVNVTGVTVGGSAATSVTTVSTTSVIAVTPAGTLGPKTVSVTASAGTGSLASGFNYTCGFTLSPTSATAPAGGATGSTVSVTTPSGCAWTAVSNDSFVTVTAGASGSGNGTVTYSVSAMPGSLQGRTGTITIGGQTFTVIQGDLPTMALDRTSLNFGAATTGAAFTATTQPQIVRLTQSHAGAVTWTVTSNRSWLTVAPSSGSGAAVLSVGVTFHNSAPVGSTDTGSLTLTFSGAANNPGPVTVNLRTYVGETSPPVGAFETPLDGTTGISGSIAVTGWALDDLEVTRVRILRDPVAGEGGSLIFIANATFVEGARGDLIPLFPTTPRNTRGGWGYLLLTNFLPNQGNGTFTLHAYADDTEGHSTLLGSKTITVDNANATKPFGAIDTPDQGDTIVGASYLNWGWVLAPGTRRADPPGGGTVTVYIDGLAVGSPFGWTRRSDITALFPGYGGLDTAVGRFSFNPSLLSDGVHTIAWVVTDNMGGADGVGSRFFSVSGGVSGSVTESVLGRSVLGGSVQGETEGAGTTSAGSLSSVSLAEEVAAAPVDTRPIHGRRGFAEHTPLREIGVDATGRAVIHGEELDRFEIAGRETPDINVGPTTVRWSGHMRVGEHLGPLPIGSRLDETTGAFTWMPGVGFVGSYDLVFVRWQGGRAVARQDVRFVLHPKGSNRVGPQVMIDTPAWGVEFGFGQSILVAGWAIDLDDTVGTGVSTVHVWAYPVTDAGHDAPIFLGVAAYGGQRPDVGAIFGERFTASAYDLLVPPLPPGAYDIAVFAWSTARSEFVPAKVVRVTVR